jgi:predicted Zn-dependent protease
VLWIAVALLPVANVLYLGPVLIAERTLYLPSVGLALTCGWWLGRLHRARPRYAIALTTMLVLVGGARSAARVPVWDSSDSVMTALMEDHPESGRAWLALGQRLLAQGREPGARRAFSYAVGILNSEYKESTEIASHLIAMGRPNSARFFLERAWRERPEWPTAPGLLASVELNAGA